MIKLNKLGYTLGEIVMTTAIIGSLAAIAIPNYLRIKMNVNMEMVKQQLRILGQNMNELYNQNNPHQYPEDIQNLDGNPAEELAITASLNAINGMGYEITHRTASGGADFSDRADPAPGMDGISGDKCFIVDSSAIVREIDCWSGEGIAMMSFFQEPASFANLQRLFDDTLLSDAEKLTIFMGWLVNHGIAADSAYESLVNSFLGGLGYVPEPYPSLTPANSVTVLTKQTQVFEQYFEKAYHNLKDRGLEINSRDTPGSEPQDAFAILRFPQWKGQTYDSFDISYQFSADPQSFNGEVQAYKDWLNKR